MASRCRGVMIIAAKNIARKSFVIGVDCRGASISDGLDVACEYAQEGPILWRRNRDMAITVRSDVVDGVQAPDVTNQISPKLQQIRDQLEPAYRIEPGGAFEESAKGNSSIFILFPVMV